jgi:hypothetical protein
MDQCMICLENISTATWNCGGHHRSCLKCFTQTREFARRNFIPFRCPFCRENTTNYQDTTSVQQGLTMEIAREEGTVVEVGTILNN